MRFKSRAVKLVGSFLLISSQLIYMGIAIYSPSTALEAGKSSLSVPYHNIFPNIFMLKYISIL